MTIADLEARLESATQAARLRQAGAAQREDDVEARLAVSADQLELTRKHVRDGRAWGALLGRKFMTLPPS